MVDKQVERKLTRNPLGYGSAHVNLPSQFAHHFEETFDCIRYTLDCIQTFTYNPINCDSGWCELQITRVSIPRRVREQKEILTLTADRKASLHKLRVNFAFAHSLRSGSGVGELRVA
jgi:hypothetical protein